MPQFMMFIYPPNTEAGYTPTMADVEPMMAYNAELEQAGIWLEGNGLLRDQAARLKWADGKTTVTDGPFTEAKELVGGYWILQCKSLEEAVEWAKRCPLAEGDMLEVRKIAEASDFPADVAEAAGF